MSRSGDSDGDGQNSSDGCGVCGQSSKLRCTRCKTTLYCSRDCQKADWRQHKRDCQVAAAQLSVVEFRPTSPLGTLLAELQPLKALPPPQGPNDRKGLKEVVGRWSAPAAWAAVDVAEDPALQIEWDSKWDGDGAAGFRPPSGWEQYWAMTGSLQWLATKQAGTVDDLELSARQVARELLPCALAVHSVVSRRREERERCRDCRCRHGEAVLECDACQPAVERAVRCAQEEVGGGDGACDGRRQVRARTALALEELVQAACPEVTELAAVRDALATLLLARDAVSLLMDRELLLYQMGDRFRRPVWEMYWALDDEMYWGNVVRREAVGIASGGAAWAVLHAVLLRLREPSTPLDTDKLGEVVEGWVRGGLGRAETRWVAREVAFLGAEQWLGDPVIDDGTIVDLRRFLRTLAPLVREGGGEGARVGGAVRSLFERVPELTITAEQRARAGHSSAEEVGGWEEWVAATSLT